VQTANVLRVLEAALHVVTLASMHPRLTFVGVEQPARTASRAITIKEGLTHWGPWVDFDVGVGAVLIKASPLCKAITHWQHLPFVLHVSLPNGCCLVPALAPPSFSEPAASTVVVMGELTT